jgi:type II secretory pathway component PulF
MLGMSLPASDVPTVTSAKASGDALSTSQLEKVCYRLGTSLKAGISVVDAWRNETQLLGGRQRRVFERVHQRLQSGDSLMVALSAERPFPPLLMAIAHVGEETGRLDQAFLRMADHYRAIVRMKRTFLQGVTWPVLQLTAAAAIMSVLFVALHLLETRVPGLVAPDLLMLGLSPLQNLLLFWAALSGAGLVLFLIAKAVRSGWLGSFPLRVAMAIPLVGSTIKELALSRFAWAFGTAVDSGMYAAQAMQFGLSSTQNRFYESHERQIATALAAGEDFFAALYRTDAFPPDLLQTVRTGELTGELTEGLARLADDYQEHAAINLRRIGQISGFSVFTAVTGLLMLTVLLMYGDYLSMVSDALRGQSLTLEQIRADQNQMANALSEKQAATTADGLRAQNESEQPNKNPILATRDAMVKDFIENNEDFKQIESMYKTLGRFNEMTPNEFLDSIAPDPATLQRGPIPSVEVPADLSAEGNPKGASPSGSR